MFIDKKKKNIGVLIIRDMNLINNCLLKLSKILAYNYVLANYITLNSEYFLLTDCLQRDL